MFELNRIGFTESISIQPIRESRSKTTMVTHSSSYEMARFYV